MNETRTVITRGRERGIPSTVPIYGPDPSNGDQVGLLRTETTLWEAYEKLQKLARLYEHAVITIQPWQIPQGPQDSPFFPRLPPLERGDGESDAAFAARDLARKQPLIEQWQAFIKLCRMISENAYVKQYYESPVQVPQDWKRTEVPRTTDLKDSWEQSYVYDSLLRMERTYF